MRLPQLAADVRRSDTAHAKLIGAVTLIQCTIRASSAAKSYRRIKRAAVLAQAAVSDELR